MGGSDNKDCVFAIDLKTQKKLWTTEISVLSGNGGYGAGPSGFQSWRFFQAYGLLEYWIVDPLERRVTVLTRRGDAWAEVVLRDEQVIGSLVLPGFATTVAELWIDIEDDENDDPPDPGANGA